MSNYTITNPALNPSRVFILQKSEVEKRWDAYFYAPERKNFYAKLKKCRTIQKLGSNIIDGSYGVLPPGDTYDDNLPITFIRATEMKEDLQIDFENTKKIEEKYFELERCRVKKNDILLAVKGATIGSPKCVSFVEEVPYPSVINGSIFKFQAKENVLPKYLAYCLNLDFAKKQMRLNLVANIAVDYLDKALISNLLIPIPNLGTQHEVIKKLDTAYSQKQTNEAEAEKLLASIDDYLLSELGITLPTPPENTLKNRMFTTSLKEISGGRFDPNYHQKYFQEVFVAFEKGKYEYSQIRKYASFQAGYAFKSTDYLEQSNCLLITIKNIRQNQIDIDDATFLPDAFYKQYKDFQIKTDDILIAMTGATIGKIGIYNHPNNSLLNQRNGIIKPDNINYTYLMSLLNLPIFQKLILRNSNGGAQPNISETDIMRIPIPVPPLSKQKEIADHITGIRNQAQALKDQTSELLKKASEAIEAILLN